HGRRTAGADRLLPLLSRDQGQELYRERGRWGAGENSARMRAPSRLLPRSKNSSTPCDLFVPERHTDRQRTFEASSARALRSPLVSVMWPARRSLRNLFTTWMRPLLVESTYGLSIWYGSPVSTILVLSPTRVMIVFTSCGVRFCASSTMMYWFGMLRPRM